MLARVRRGEWRARAMCCADKRWAGCATAQRVLCDEPAAAERSDRRSARASWRRSGSACGCLVRRPDRRCFRHSRNSPLLQRLFVGTNTGLIHVFAWPSSAEATKLSEFQVGSLNMRRRWSKCATANMRHVQCHATCNIMCCGACNMRPCNGQRVLHNSIASVVATKQGDFRVGSFTSAIHCCLRIVPVCRAHGARMYWIHLCAPQAHKSPLALAAERSPSRH
jgi:hypothetical protein